MYLHPILHNTDVAGRVDKLNRVQLQLGALAKILHSKILTLLFCLRLSRLVRLFLGKMNIQRTNCALGPMDAGYTRVSVSRICCFNIFLSLTKAFCE